MMVGTLRIALRLHGPRSLKEKRAIVSPLIQKLRQKYQASVAEIEDHDLWGNATIGIGVVSNSIAHIESVLTAVERDLDSHANVELMDIQREIERR
jgi:uncharacterized protein